MGICYSSKVSEDFEHAHDKEDHNHIKSVVSGTGEAMQTAGVGIALAAGAGLLNAAEAVPFIAPVAYLIGSIVVACQNAQSLKSDAREFAILVQELERILLKCKDLKEHRNTIDAIYDLLDEGMAFVRTLSKTNIFVQVMASKYNTETLISCRDRLMALIQTLDVGIGIDTNFMHQLKFDDEQKLKALVDDMGGADAIVKSPAQLQIVQEAMSDSDKMLLALQKVHFDESKNMRIVIDEGQKKADEQHKNLIEALASSLQEQRTRTQASERQHALLTMQNKLLMQRVEEMQFLQERSQMMMIEFMSRFPVHPKEAERVVTVEELHLLDIQGGAISGLEDHLEEFILRTNKSAEGLEINMGTVSIINLDTQRAICMRMVHPRDGDLIGRGSTPMECSRKIASCQYVVAEDAVVCYRSDISDPSTERLMSMPQKWTTDITGALGEKGIQFMTDFLSGMPPFVLARSALNGEISHEAAKEKALTEFEMSLSDWRIMEAMAVFDDSTQKEQKGLYCGAPLRILGQVVGTICFYIKASSVTEKMSSEEILQVLKVEEAGEKASELIEQYAKCPIHQQYIKEKRRGG